MGHFWKWIPEKVDAQAPELFHPFLPREIKTLNLWRGILFPAFVHEPKFRFRRFFLNAIKQFLRAKTTSWSIKSLINRPIKPCDNKQYCNCQISVKLPSYSAVNPVSLNFESLPWVSISFRPENIAPPDLKMSSGRNIFLPRSKRRWAPVTWPTRSSFAALAALAKPPVPASSPKSSIANRLQPTTNPAIPATPVGPSTKTHHSISQSLTPPPITR